MLSDSSKSAPTPRRVPWSPLLAVAFVLAIFYTAQIVAAVALSFYGTLQGWSRTRSIDWLTDSVIAQFSFVLLTEALIIGAIYYFLKHYKVSWTIIGLKRPRWSDVGVGIAAAPVYYILYLLVVGAATMLIPSLDISQEQQIGFANVAGSTELILTFISLAVLPPIAEEILVRGFLYSSLKKALPIIWAVFATSFIFAAAHLPAGGAAGLLWIGFIDTFVLSLVLIYLREKTGSLWASITLHAIKNSVAFFVLFVFGGR